MINKHLIYTYADGLNIITICTVTGDVLDRHIIPEKHHPFIQTITDAVIHFLADSELMAYRFTISKTPFCIQRSNGALTVYIKANQAVYDMFLYVASVFEFEVRDLGYGLRLI